MSLDSPLPPASLGDSRDTLLELGIAGYEFPAYQPRKERDWDANWLQVMGRVHSSGAGWRFRHPCLTTWELSELIDWLESLPGPADAALGFTEPLLEFEWRPGEDRPLRLRLRGEALPDSVDHNSRCEGRTLAFPFDQDAVRAFAARLRACLAAFPAR